MFSAIWKKSLHVRMQKKTLLAYLSLPNPFVPENVDICYGYDGKKNSINSRIKRLLDDGLVQKIRSGVDKGKYRKLV